MKNILMIAALLSALFVVACDNAQEPTISNNYQQNIKASTETKGKKSSAERLVKVKSEKSFDDTYNSLKKAIEILPLKIITELDHQENAKKSELELRPTKIIMFGNPTFGTPLMNENQTIGIDLPQKMLVYKDEKGDVYLVYNDPKALADTHEISRHNEIIGKISEVLKRVAVVATKKKVENRK